jgi:hypothetical protein
VFSESAIDGLLIARIKNSGAHFPGMFMKFNTPGRQGSGTR